MTEPDNASAKLLVRAAEIGKEVGLSYVYAGNLPGQVGEFENTWCPSCDGLLVQRTGFSVGQVRIGKDGCSRTAAESHRGSGAKLSGREMNP